MLRGARLFVFIVFAVLALTFVAETAALAVEFWPNEWINFATQDSHTFLFFPTLGILALAAFYAPSVAITSLYWSHVRAGRLRFSLGFLVLAGLAFVIATALNESRFRSAWEIKPEVLAADASEPKGCGVSGGAACDRLAILEAVDNVSLVSRSRLGLHDFVAACTADTMMEPSPEPERKRFCFAASPLSEKPPLLSVADCCRAQVRFQDAISGYASAPGNISLTSRVHAALLPFKVFFLLMLAVISLLLAVRHRSVARRYPDDINIIDLGVVVGAMAMVFFPLMSQAFVETADALFGQMQNEGFKPIVPFMSFAFGGWALLLLMFFYRRHDREVEFAGKIAGIIASAVAVVKYDLIISLINRFLGSGAGAAAFGILIILTLFGLIVLLSPLARRAIEPGPMQLDDDT